MKSAAQKLDVKILLADDETFMREIISNALTAGGYRDIRSVGKLDLLEEVLGAVYPDLLIINGEMPDGDAIEFVRRIRLFRVGRNPFIPIVMTAWHSDGPFVRKVVDSGVDVLMTKPFAAGQLFARIDFLTNSRLPFVATGTYLGPDRRKSNRNDDFPLFDVPNTLRERVEGKIYDAEDIGDRVVEAFAKVKAQRRTMQEWNIGRFFAAVDGAVREGRPIEELDEAVDALIAAIAAFAEEGQSMRPAKVMTPAHVLVETVKAIAASGKGFSEADCEKVRTQIADLNIQIPANGDFVGGFGNGGDPNRPAAP